MKKTWSPGADADTTYEGNMTKNPESPIHSTETPADSDRKSFVRRWIDGKMRRWAERSIAGGIGSSVLALPVLAQATSEDLAAFQFVETIPGVRSVKQLDNGDVLLRLADGRKVVVAAENVQVLDSGSIMIAENAAAEIAQFSLVAEAGGAAAAGGISGVGAALGGLGLAGAAAAASGGGGGDDSTPPPAPSFPHLNLAGAQTNALSTAALGVSAPEGTDTVEVSIGSMTTTAAPNSDGSWNATFTSLEASGLPQGIHQVEIRNLDSDGAELSVETFTFDVDTLPPTLAISGFSDGAVLNAAEQSTDLVVSGTTDAEDGQTVAVTVNGQSYTGAVQGGQWSATVPAGDLTALPDGATIAVSANVTDEAGNPAPQASASFDTDFSAPTISLDPVSGGSIELIDLSSDLTLTGTTTAADGQTVSVSFEGQTYITTASGGIWSATIPSADLAGLTTGSPATVSVTVADAAGNISVPASATVPVDLTGPSLAITPLSVGNVLNASEIGADLIISGTSDRVEDGQIVTVALDGRTYTGAVSGGNWSVTVPTADLAGMADGGSFTITADVSDTDGLSAPQVSLPLSKDVYEPTEGSVMLDGVDIRQIDPGDLRRNIGSVLQDIWLFSGSIRENIASGAIRPRDKDIIEAGRVAGVEDFVSRHPRGYDMQLAERGEGLSGGQRQAIALARAMIGRPPVLLLDEPSSAMDVKTEAEVISRLKQATEDTTMIIITHRTSLLALVDRVIVIDNGRVSADGPKSLLTQHLRTPRRKVNVAAS